MSAGRTAMARSDLSRPVALAIQDEVLTGERSFFDYGCGRGGDVRRLTVLGFAATGWDPEHAPDGQHQAAEVVNLGYVVNVIEDPEERRQALQKAWSLARSTLIVSARLDWEARGLAGRPHADGWLTSAGTFQKFFTHDGLRAWIESVLGLAAVAAAPGVFYVFREEGEAERFRTRQVLEAVPRRRLDPHVELAHFREELEDLLTFVERRGRLPHQDELAAVQPLERHFGSLHRAVDLVERVQGRALWSPASSRARQDLTVYLALTGFGGRPKASNLSQELLRDIKSAFGSYRAAVAAADELLFSLRRQDVLDQALSRSSVGKKLPDALYVHVSCFRRLDPVLRAYEGCARALLGQVQAATIVKLQRLERRVAYLSYPRFDQDPHPELDFSLRVDLRTFDVKFRDFSLSANPPILHRKEAFVDADYPRREVFAKLTRQEDKAGLLSSVSIGTKEGWEQALAAAGYAVTGHRLVRAPVPGSLAVRKAGS